MVVAGALLAAYGPVLPAFGREFGVDEGAAGVSLGVQSAGAVLGVLLAQPLLRLHGNRFTIAGSVSLMAAGGLVVAFAGSWPLLLVGAVAAGLGLGGVDSLITQLFIVGHGHRGPLMVNIAHGCFGLGTVLAPLSIAVVGPDNYGVPFIGIAVLALVALLTTSGVRPRPTPAEADLAGSADRSTFPAPVRPVLMVLGAFVALYLLHFGVQSAIGSWEPTFLLDLGYTSASGALATSGFWFAMVVGRFVAAPLTSVVAPAQLVVGSCVGLALAAACTFYAPGAVIAFLFAGFFIGPIFPNGLNWLATTGFATGSRFAYVIAASLAGSALAPVAFGAILNAYGLDVFPIAVVVVSVLTLLAGVAARVLTRDRSSV